MYFALEGVDGSGTTTLANALVEDLQRMGVSVVQVGEPSNSPIGRLVRDYFEGRHGDLPNWRTMLCLFQADREIHMERVEEYLANEMIVISDRCWLSTLVYQAISAGKEAGEIGENVEEAEDEAKSLIMRLNEKVRSPDATFVIDVPFEVSLERRAKRKGLLEDHYEKDDPFLRKVCKAYQAVGGPGVQHIDGRQDVDSLRKELFLAVSKETGRDFSAQLNLWYPPPGK